MSECIKLNPAQVEHLTGSAQLATEPVYMSERAWQVFVATVNRKNRLAYEKGKVEAMSSVIGEIMIPKKDIDQPCPICGKHNNLAVYRYCYGHEDNEQAAIRKYTEEYMVNCSACGRTVKSFRDIYHQDLDMDDPDLADALEEHRQFKAKEILDDCLRMNKIDIPGIQALRHRILMTRDYPDKVCDCEYDSKRLCVRSFLAGYKRDCYAGRVEFHYDITLYCSECDESLDNQTYYTSFDEQEFDCSLLLEDMENHARNMLRNYEQEYLLHKDNIFSCSDCHTDKYVSLEMLSMNPESYTSTQAYMVKCHKCGKATRVFVTEDNAVDAWNKGDVDAK